MEQRNKKGCHICEKIREYYHEETKVAVWLEWKLSYYSRCELTKIVG